MSITNQVFNLLIARRLHGAAVMPVEEEEEEECTCDYWQCRYDTGSREASLRSVVRELNKQTNKKVDTGISCFTSWSGSISPLRSSYIYPAKKMQMERMFIHAVCDWSYLMTWIFFFFSVSISLEIEPLSDVIIRGTLFTWYVKKRQHWIQEGVGWRETVWRISNRSCRSVCTGESHSPLASYSALSFFFFLFF